MGRFGPAFAAIWLIYLSFPWSTAWSAARGPARTLSLVSVVVFGVVYLAAMVTMRAWRHAGAPGRRMPYAWAFVTGEAVLTAGMAAAAHASAFAGFVFLGVTAVFTLARAEAVVVVVALVVVSESVPRVLPGWVPLDSVGVQIALAAVAVFGVTEVMRRNVDLARARLELADLAVARERERIARDVHDLLGHSLTVITVKAELAQRLAAHTEGGRPGGSQRRRWAPSAEGRHDRDRSQSATSRLRYLTGFPSDSAYATSRAVASPT